MNDHQFSRHASAWQRPVEVVEAVTEVESVIASPQSFATLVLQAGENPEASYFLLAELFQRIVPMAVSSYQYRAAFNALTRAYESLPKHVIVYSTYGNPVEAVTLK